MKSTFIIKVGDEHYGSDFNINERSKINWPSSFLTMNVEEARVFKNASTAKAMATRLHKVLLEYIKCTPGSDHYEREPITIVEILQTIRPIIHTKPSVKKELYNE